MRPLVEPGPPLGAADAVRFSRHTVLPQLGEIGQRRLRAARVCVVGAGGLGSPVLLYLAAAGVGTLGIVDRDEVDLSNLQRQILHAADDVGRRKVASARAAVLALDPSIAVRAHHGDLDAENALAVLGEYDLVLDGTDNFPTRYLVNDACAALGLPLVWGSVLGFDAQVSVFWSAPPEHYDVPAVDLRDLFPEAPAAHEVPSCAEAGVVGALCGQVGSLMATEAVKLITGVGEPLLGRVLTLDALRARWREVPLRRAPGRVAPVPVAPRTSAGHAPAVPACVPPAVAPGQATLAAAAPGQATLAAVAPGQATLAAVAPGQATLAAAAPGQATLTAAELAARLDAGPALALIDVREAHEHAAGAIPGSWSVPLSALRAGSALTSLPPGPLVLYCAVGVRSAEALGILRSAGRTDAAHLAGGIQAWHAHAAGVRGVAASGGAR